MENLYSLITDTASKDTKEALQNSFASLKISIDNYLNKLEQVESSLSNQKALINSTPNKRFSVEKSKRAEVLERVKEQIYSNQSIENLGVEGYTLLNQIRTFFTGENITYTLAYENEQGNLIVQENVPVEIILNNAYLAYDHTTSVASISHLFKIKAHNQKIIQDLQRYLANSQEDNESEELDFQEGHSTLWSAIMSMAVDKAARGDRGWRQINRGRLFELYYTLTKSLGWDNHLGQNGLTQSQKIIIGQQYAKIRKDREGFYKGGDYENEQLKLLSAGDISLFANFNTLKKNLSQLNEAFNSNNYSNIEKKVKEIFLKKKSKFMSESERQHQDKIAEEIEKIVTSLR